MLWIPDSFPCMNVKIGIKIAEVGNHTVWVWDFFFPRRESPVLPVLRG